MPARTGRQYLSGLREQDREVWLAGERVKDVTTHPGLKNGARAIASLYDLQSDPKLRDEMTYVSPSTGDRVGLSFIIPRTREDLEKRRVMMLNWARTTCGMMGRSPDFMNVTYAAWAGAADYFAAGEHGRPEFAENMRRYYEYIRENDLTLTHSLINLQRSRTVSGVFNLRRGRRSRSCARPTPASSCAARGSWRPWGRSPTRSASIRRAWRAMPRPTARSRSALRSRAARRVCGSCAARALISAARISTTRSARALRRWIASSSSTTCWCRGSGCFCWAMSTCSTAPPLSTHSTAHSAHQGAVKNLAKAEFVLGVALLMTQALGNAHLPNVEERIGELMLITQLTRACMRAAEADAQLDEWGVMCPEPLMVESPRNLFMTAYPKMVEILQLLGSSSFMLTPTEADFKGPLADHIEQYLATDNMEAKDRVKLFRLAWDIAGTSFGSRQVLYERFFASDPLTRARAIASIYPKKEVMDRVLEFLGRDDDAL